MMRLTILCCLLVMTVSACRVPPAFRERSWIDEQTINPTKRYYVDNGISFLPPSLPNGNVTSWDYQVAFKVSYQSPRARITIAVTSGEVRQGSNMPDKETYYKRSEQWTDKENQRRAAILAGTVEEHWQKELVDKGGMDAIIAGFKIMDEDGYGRPLKTIYKTREAQEKWVKDSFVNSLRFHRDRLRGLPNDTYQRVTVNNWDCLQTDSYERLTTPLGEYATKLGGGIKQYRDYTCYLRADLIPSISASVSLAPDVNAKFDIDAALKPLLNSITIDESLPATHTTFQIMKANEQ